jgi:hypothetical protein
LPEELVVFDQPLPDALPQVEEPRSVEGGRSSAAEQGGGEFGWHEVLDALPAVVPVSGPLASMV